MDGWGAEPTPKLVEKEWDDEDADLNDVKESWDEDDDKKDRVVKEPTVTALEKPDAEALEKDEEADFKSTSDHELFGKDVEYFISKSQNDFKEYAELIYHKCLQPYEKRFHYKNLVIDLMRLCMTSLNGVDDKELASNITAIANEKIKAECNKKKTGGKKKKLNARKDNNAYDAEYDGPMICEQSFY